jgi:hypothetical protein
MSMNYMSNTITISNKKALELRYETHSPINRPSAFSFLIAKLNIYLYPQLVIIPHPVALL